MTVTVVSVSLNQVAGSGACSGANQSALLSADQCASKQPCAGSDERSLGPAVVNAVVMTS
jgi:hypothetical protein